MNKSVIKCCICNNENIGQFITINNKKYHLCCIEQLQQENKILKEKVNKLEILIETLKLGVTLNQEQEDLLDKILFGGDSNE